MGKLNYSLLAVVAAFGTVGCQSAVVETKDSAIYDASTAGFDDLTKKLLTDFQELDISLLALSKGHYSCGNPQKVRSYIVVSPADQVEADETARSNLIGYAEKVLKDYHTAITKIDARQDASGDILAMGDAAGAVVTAVSGQAAYGAVVTEVFKGINLGLIQGINFQLKELAEAADKPATVGLDGPLTAAVKTLQDNYKLLSQPSATAFALWDSCAREKWYYLRDVASPQGIPLKNGTKLPAYVAQPSALELDAAWKAYRAQRLTYVSDRQSQDQYKASLQKIIALNDALRSYNGFDKSSKNAEALATALATAYTTFDNARQKIDTATVSVQNAKQASK